MNTVDSAITPRRAAIRDATAAAPTNAAAARAIDRRGRGESRSPRARTRPRARAPRRGRARRARRTRPARCSSTARAASRARAPAAAGSRRERAAGQLGEHRVDDVGRARTAAPRLDREADVGRSAHGPSASGTTAHVISARRGEEHRPGLYGGRSLEDSLAHRPRNPPSSRRKGTGTGPRDRLCPGRRYCY